MGDTAINVPVDVRTHELNQLQSWLPAIADELRAADITEGAETIERIYDEHVADVGHGPNNSNLYVSMPQEDWRMTMRYLNRARTLGRNGNDLRAHWLQTKLIDRLEDRLEEMK